MEMKEDIIPITALKAQAAGLLARLNETRRPVVVTQNGVARAVLQDPESFARQRQALGLLKLLALGEADLRAARTEGQETLFARLKKKLQRGRGHG